MVGVVGSSPFAPTKFGREIKHLAETPGAFFLPVRKSGARVCEWFSMGLLTFSINTTLDGCIDHREGIADDDTHAFFTRLMDAGGAMLWGRVTYEMMETYWPAVACGDIEAPPAMREWAVKLEAKPKHVVSSTRKDFPWTNSHLIAGDLRNAVQQLKDATPAGVLLGSGQLATELDRLRPDRRVPVPRPPEDCGPRSDPVPERAAQHATARAACDEAAAQRCGGLALPSRALKHFHRAATSRFVELNSCSSARTSVGVSTTVRRASSFAPTISSSHGNCTPMIWLPRQQRAADVQCPTSGHHSTPYAHLIGSSARDGSSG